MAWTSPRLEHCSGLVSSDCQSRKSPRKSSVSDVSLHRRPQDLEGKVPCLTCPEEYSEKNPGAEVTHVSRISWYWGAEREDRTEDNFLGCKIDWQGKV